jgi:hypothetical protein
VTEPQEPRGGAPLHPTPEELSGYAHSPQEAAASLREHTEGCAACAAEVEDLRLVLATLAQLPEPALPAEVGIRLDAALARAWQEADAEQVDAEQIAFGRPAAGSPSASGGASGRRGWRLGWRRLALPLGALGLLVVAGVGVGFALSQGGTAGSTSSAGAAAQSGSDAALNTWVRSVLPRATYNGAVGATTPGAIPQVQNGTDSSAGAAHPNSVCASYPQRTGYTVLTTAERTFDGRPATLVVYQNDQGPASPTVFAVVYAGPCPNASSQVLDQGVVSR